MDNYLCWSSFRMAGQAPTSPRSSSRRWRRCSLAWSETGWFSARLTRPIWRSSRITVTEAAEARLPEAVAALLRGNHEALCDFTDEEAGLLLALLTRLIANLDRLASAEAPPGTPVSEKGGLIGPFVWRLIESEP